MVGMTGLEPVTPALSAQCSNHLSYTPLKAKFFTELIRSKASPDDYFSP